MSRLFLISLFSILLLPLKAEEKPNIIVIFTDDHGWPDIGAVGVYDDLKTPHINQLAADGARCTNGYSTAPQCVPSRGGLLTGRDQSRFGLETNGSSLGGFNAEETIAERLQKVGYKTGQIGKWHLGPGPEIKEHGFDEVYAKNSGRPAWATFRLDGSDREPGMDETKLYHLDACSQAATAFIDRHSESPFFLYLAYRAPHVPLDATEKYLSRFPGEMPERRRQALAMISAMDDGVGAIREKLEEHGLSEKTLIFFIGDNGAPLKIHKIDAPGGGPGWDGSLNAPMNGEKGMLAEGGIRVPFVVAWPGRIPAGRVYDEPVISLDVAATAAGLARLPDVERLDGANLVPYLSGEAEGAPHECLFWRWSTQSAVREGKECLFWRWSTQSAVREGKWKFLRGGAREYLFDLDADPGETKNLIQEQPEIKKRLKRRLLTWTEELDPPGLLGDNMPETWMRYYDHYLDGKPASRDAMKESKDDSVEGWIIRNGKLKREGKVLRILDPDGEQRLTPFLANSRIRVKGPVQVAVSLVGPVKGELSVQWREEGEKDFLKENAAKLSREGQDWRGEIRTEAEVIHLRIRFPNGNAEIRSISLSGADGKNRQRWSFGME